MTIEPEPPDDDPAAIGAGLAVRIPALQELQRLAHEASTRRAAESAFQSSTVPVQRPAAVVPRDQRQSALDIRAAPKPR